MNDTFNTVAIDPGTSTIGVSIFTISAIDLSIVNIETILIDTTLRFNEVDLVSDLLIRLNKLHERIKEIIRYYNPLMVAIENGFINKLRPAAYGPLSQSIMAIELAVLYTNPNIRIFKFAPKTIKKVSTEGGAANKDDVLLGISSIPEIINKINPALLSEHEVDSIAVNYTLLDYVRYNRCILLML